QRHARLHTGYKPYTCPGCQAGFFRTDALRRHLKATPNCQSVVDQMDEPLFKKARRGGSKADNNGDNRHRSDSGASNTSLSDIALNQIKYESDSQPINLFAINSNMGAFNTQLQQHHQYHFSDTGLEVPSVLMPHEHRRTSSGPEFHANAEQGEAQSHGKSEFAPIPLYHPQQLQQQQQQVQQQAQLMYSHYPALQVATSQIPSQLQSMNIAGTADFNPSTSDFYNSLANSANLGDIINHHNAGNGTSMVLDMTTATATTLSQSPSDVFGLMRDVSQH
ncbi:hypothetical protein GQ42DRAFT_35172, partial [Ramicandelaber brevisporus]